MQSKEYLLEQIARAKRFVKGMNSKDDKEKFEKIAADYQSQLDAAETAASTAATETAPSEAAASSNEAVAATNETGPSDAAAPHVYRALEAAGLTGEATNNRTTHAR
jgi:hypothetical protein